MGIILFLTCLTSILTTSDVERDSIGLSEYLPYSRQISSSSSFELVSVDPVSVLDSAIKLKNEQLQLRVQQLEETAQSKEQELDQHKKITEGILTKMHHDML